MSCESLISHLGFECTTLADGALRVWTPFTYGEDGEVVGLYVEPVGARLRVTDHADALFHAASMGIKLSKPRLESLRRVAGPNVTISDGGEIFTSAHETELTDALVVVMNAALSVGHFETVWKPRSRRRRR